LERPKRLAFAEILIGLVNSRHSRLKLDFRQALFFARHGFDSVFEK
jgi:hypothetical protein